MPQKHDIKSEHYQKSAEFRPLLRMIATSIEGHRTLAFGLSQIKGVGRRLAQAIIRVAGYDPQLRVGQLTEEQQTHLEEMIRDPLKFGIPSWLLNRQKDLRTGEDRHVVGTDIDLLLKLDIDRMKRNRSWKGIRHMYGLKVRGQRTRCTGRKGLVVGYYRETKKKTL